MAEGSEILVPFSSSRPSSVPLATHARGTVLVSSLRSLGKRGYSQRHIELVEPPFRDAILAATAASWIPADVMVAHYTACDRLNLDREVMESIGAESGEFIYSKMVSMAIRFSVETGVTPWHVLAHAHTLRDRTWRGSDIEVRRMGPKDAQFTWCGMPCAQSFYYRHAFTAFLGAVLRPFCRRIYTRVVAEKCDGATATYRAAWV